MSLLEIAANAVVALAIFLAGRNNIHTWWIGIIGCGLFAALFYQSQLYADVTLQGFFIITGFIGWYRWSKGLSGEELPITKTHVPTLVTSVIIALIVGGAYAFMLQRFKLTALLYAAYWVHAIIAWRKWKREYAGQGKFLATQ